MSKYLVVFSLLLGQVSMANYIDDKVTQYSWNSIEVIHLEDETYPTFDLAIQFDAGAYFDAEGKAGQTQVMFDLLSSGTDRYSQEEIIDTLDFYGSSQQAQVTHEFSSYNVSGLVQHAAPTMKMVCHLFRGATFPKDELKRHTDRLTTALRNLASNHSALANRAFRQLSFEGTGYERPVEGDLKSLKALEVADLKSKLLEFNDKVSKKIYLRGPRSLLKLKGIFENDCAWGPTAKDYSAPEVQREPSKDDQASEIYLISVPSANQTQIRIGNVLGKKIAHKEYALTQLATQYLGGGFTSELMQEVRVRKGLTYSIGAYASPQKNYARAGINTFTKNETIVETLKTIQDVIAKSSKNVSQERLAMVKRYSKGAYLFGLESAADFLSNLIYFDHIGRPYSDIYRFPERVDSISAKQLMRKVAQIFDPQKQMTVLVGDASIKSALEKEQFKVKLLNYTDFL